MKYFFLLIALLVNIFSSLSQSLPINYQAVIRDNQGAILANEAVTLRFTLLQGSANGTALYLEEHQETTNQFGLINIQLGTGIVLGGDFFQIDWSLLDYYLKLEIQNGNGQGFTDLGTSKFVAVPYANFALNAANVNNNDTSATNELQSLTINNNIINLDNNGGTVDLTPYLDNTDSQTLTRTGNQISISGGNNITLPADQVFDGDSSVFNELQAISFVNDTLTLSNGGKVYLGAYDNSQAILFTVTQLVSINNKQKADSALFFNLIQLNSNDISNNSNQLLLLNQKISSDSLLLQSQLNNHIINDSDLDSLNELQIINISNDTLYLSKGGFAVLPNDNVDDADNNPTNEIQAINLSNDTLFLSGGGFVVLPADEVNDNDADSTNELQSLTLSGNSISLSNANTINLPFDNDTSSTNELQALNLSNDTLYLTNGGFVKLPNDNVFDGDSSLTNELQVLSVSNDTISLTNGGFIVLPADNVNDADADSLNELQLLFISNDTLSLTNGNFIVLPADLVNDIDADTTNEVQSLSIDGNSLSISKGNSVLLPNDNDTSSLNEIQSISISNDTVFLNNGGFVILPADQVNDADNNPTNELQILSISNDSLKLSNGGFVDLTNYDNMQAVLELYSKLKTDSAIFSNLINTNSNNIALKGSQLDTTNQVLENHLTNDLDIDSLNEIQALTISNDTLFLENGGFVDLTGFRDYNSLTNKPDSLSDFVNDAGFLTNQNTSSFQIGDTAFGGIIFYVSPNGNSGLVISLNDITTDKNYREASYSISNLNLLSNGFADWRLPNIKELNIVFDSLYSKSLGGLNGYYWSSTIGSINSSQISVQEFSAPNRCPTSISCITDFTISATSGVKARAVRSFGEETIIIPENLDNDSTNEIQQLSISNDTISLNKGGYIKLPKDSFTVYKGDNGIKISNDTISKEKIQLRVSSINDTLWIDESFVIIPGLSFSNPTPSLPSVSTNSPTVASNFAILKGNISSNGNLPITKKGFIWSTNQNLDFSNFSDSVSLYANTTGNFEFRLSNLSPNSQFYVRSYAENSIGISFGIVETIVTKSDTLIFDYEGNQYGKVKIGTQTWLNENLRTTRFQNGTIISNITSQSTWQFYHLPAWCSYNNSTSNLENFGALYNWWVVNDTNNVCPIGWHVATKLDYDTLVNFLSTNVGGKLKSTDLQFWSLPNTSATNEVGFNAKGSGIRSSSGQFSGALISNNIWTSTTFQNDPSKAFYLNLNYSVETHSLNTAIKYLGYSIRCIKD